MRDVTATLVGFARTLRAAGVGADAQRLQTMVRALDHLDVLDPSDVYWAGRLTLCADPDDLTRYDRCFAAYFPAPTPHPGRPRPPPLVIMQSGALPSDGTPSGPASD